MDFPQETNLSPLIFQFARRGLFFFILGFSGVLCSLESHLSLKAESFSKVYQSDPNTNLDTEFRTQALWSITDLSCGFSQKFFLQNLKIYVDLGVDPLYASDFYQEDPNYSARSGVQFLDQYLEYDDSDFRFQSGFIQERKKFPSYNHRLIEGLEAVFQFLHMRDCGLSLSGSIFKNALSLQFDVWQRSENRRINNFYQNDDVLLESFSDLDAVWLAHFFDENSFSNHHTQTAYALSLAFVPFCTEDKGLSWSGHLLSAPFQTTELIAVASAYGEDTTVKLSAYNTFSQLFVAYRYYWDRFAFETRSEYLHSPLAKSYQVGTDPYAQIFDQDAQAYSYELSGLCHYGRKGLFYSMDPKTGVLRSEGKGWIVGLSYGAQFQKNLFALVSGQGKNDFLSSAYLNISGQGRLKESAGIYPPVRDALYTIYAVDNSPPVGQDQPYVTKGTTTPNSQNAQEAFQVKSTTYSLMLAYRFLGGVQWTNTFSQTQRKKLIFGQDFYSSQTDRRPSYVASPQSARCFVWKSVLSAEF